MKFAKTGPLMYVGHLDLLRYFQKAFRRAGVDIAYSNGFSPHQITSFAAPLGIGVTSEGEYMDAEFVSTKSSQEMLHQINAALGTPYITVTEFVALPDDAKKAMAAVAGADYRVRVLEHCENRAELFSAVAPYLQQPSICIVKKTKKSETQMDIRPLIHQMRVEGDAIYMRLTTGSTDNLRPDMVMESLFGYLKMEHNPLDYRIHRLDTLLLIEDENGSRFEPLSYVGTEIL